MPLPERLPVTTGQPTHLPPPAAPVQLYGERRVTYVPDALNPGQSVAIDPRLLQPAIYQPARDLSPQPLLDPFAQRILATGVGGGVFAAGAGWGVGEAAGGLAGIGTGSLFWLALILAATRLPRLGRARVHHETHNHVTNHNRWFGNSRTNLH